VFSDWVTDITSCCDLHLAFSNRWHCSNTLIRIHMHTSGATRFSEKQWVIGSFSLVSTFEELLERKK
jgi:hypothetical protein